MTPDRGAAAVGAVLRIRNTADTITWSTGQGVKGMNSSILRARDGKRKQSPRKRVQRIDGDLLKGMSVAECVLFQAISDTFEVSIEDVQPATKAWEDFVVRGLN